MLLMAIAIGVSPLNSYSEEEENSKEEAEKKEVTKSYTLKKKTDKKNKCEECTKDEICSVCVATGKKSVEAIDGVSSVEIDGTKITVVMAETVKESKIISALSKAGFSVKISKEKKKKKEKEE